MKLRDRTIWLIGASSGIGAALAPALAAEGARLTLSARREAELERVADAAALRGPRPLVKPLDVSQQAEIERVYAELTAEWGRVDVLFYNAGTWAQADVAHFDTDAVLEQIDVIYLGLVRAVGCVMPDMIARRHGDIIGMASVAGYAGLPTAAAYSSSKAAVNAFLQSLRVELSQFKVGVTTINPGFIKTPLTDHNEFPMPFLISPEEATDQITRGLLAGHAEIHFPKRLTWPLKVVTALPRPVFEFIARNGMLRRR